MSKAKHTPGPWDEAGAAVRAADAAAWDEAGAAVRAADVLAKAKGE